MVACASSAVPLNQSATGWTSSGTQAPFSAVDTCQGGGRMQLSVRPSTDITPGLQAQWATVVPAGMSLTGLGVPAEMALINPDTQNAQGGGGFNVRYLWGGGSVEVPVGSHCCGGMDYAGPTLQVLSGRWFIIQVACNASSAEPNGDCIYGANEPNQIFNIKNFTLTAADDTPPTLSAPPSAGAGTNLWSARAWVRGSFTLAFTSSNPNGSGVCATAAYLDGTALPGGSSSPVTDTQWQRCDVSLGFSDGIDTTTLANG